MSKEELLLELANIINKFERSNGNNKLVECSVAVGEDFELFVFNGESFVQEREERFIR